MQIQTKTVVPLLLAATLCCAGAATADLGSGAETEQNRFSWHPSMRTSIALDDNTELEEKNGNSDIGFFFFPRLELGYQGRWFDLGVDVGADVRQYSGKSSPSDQFYRAVGHGEFGILPGLSIGFSNAYVPTPVNLGLPEDHASNLIQTNRTTAEVRYWREIPWEGEVVASLQGARHFSERFTADLANGVRDNDFRADYWEGTAQIEAQAPLLDNTSGFVRTYARFLSFDDSYVSDFGDLAIMLGVRTHWFKNIDFDIAGGYGLVGFNSGDLKHRFLGEMNLRYRFSEGTTLRFAFENRNTVDIAGNDFLETTGRLGVERRFGERTAAELTLFISRFDNGSWNSGANLYGGVEASLRRQLTRRTQVELEYRYWKNAGSYDSDNFSQNQLVVSIIYGR